MGGPGLSSPAWVVGALPSRFARRARSRVFFSGIASSCSGVLVERSDPFAAHASTMPSTIEAGSAGGGALPARPPDMIRAAGHALRQHALGPIHVAGTEARLQERVVEDVTLGAGGGHPHDARPPRVHPFYCAPGRAGGVR